MGISSEKYSVSSSKIHVNNFEQFASARTWFQPPNSKLVPLEIWGYLQRNTVSVCHKYMWIRNMIIGMMIFSILIDFAFFRSQFRPTVLKFCHFEMWWDLERNTMLKSHKSNYITNMIILMMMMMVVLPLLRWCLISLSPPAARSDIMMIFSIWWWSSS